MSFSLSQILLVIVVYLSGLFVVAYVADRGLLPRRITDHPAVYVLSLGVFGGAMATNGVMDLAQRYGYNFLLYYFGVVLMFVLYALILSPLLRLCRVYQLASLADLLTFRFRSPLVGAAITVAMCVTVMPLLALQIEVVADSISILTGGPDRASPRDPDIVAMIFCIVISVFAILFGTGHSSTQRRHTGLVMAIAFESLVKLLALMAVLFAAVYGVFGSFADLDQWLRDSPQLRALVQQPILGETARSLLLLFFAGAVCMPHMFHMAFTENSESRHLSTASWGLPLYLMLLSLPILPVTWAGLSLGGNIGIDYSSLAIGLEMRSNGITVAAFIASLSAASATIIVATLALANMCLNHLVLPSRLLRLDKRQSIPIQLQWLRRPLIAGLILGGYLFYVVLDGRQSLTELALMAFTGTLQFLPGIAATLYWPAANRKGLLVGLGAGLTLWLLAMLLPAIFGYQPPLPQVPGTFYRVTPDNLWIAVTMASLAFNTGCFLLVSLLTRSSEEERVASEICSMDDLARPARRTLSLQSASEFAPQLSSALGEDNARAEVERALSELQFSIRETRPYALRRLRTRIEANLSGLMGPAVAYQIVERYLPYQPGVTGSTEDIQLIERNLDREQAQFRGMAADLDNLRRHYRETLDKLPIGVCSIGADGELLLWNRSMAEITGIPASDILGSLLESIPPPWRETFIQFQLGNTDSLLKTEVAMPDGLSRWISLHKAPTADDILTDTVILVEDITELQRLEDEVLHNERLASIGRLAAGVAHEIGNPVTGIACLAQNLEYETEPRAIEETAQDILQQTERINRIVESLVNFSHSGAHSLASAMAPTNVADCVEEAIHLLDLDHRARPVNFNNSCDRDLLVLADSQRLLQAIINLLGNARDASPDDGEIRILAATDGEVALIEVEDDGCGIPHEVQRRVFEPFFTTKDPGEGTGLGLALVHSIMDDMGGSVQITSPLHRDDSSGTRVTLKLPVSHFQNVDTTGDERALQTGKIDS